MDDATPVRPTLLMPGAGRDRSEGGSRLDLLEVLATTAHARLRALAVIGSVAFGAGTVLALTVPALLGRPWWEQAVMAALCSALALASLIVWRFARGARPATSTVIRVGLIYVVLTTLAMAVAEVAIGPRAAADYDGVPGMCIWIVLFPLVIPCLPWQALLTALLCASTLPLVYVVMVLFGREASDPAALVRWFAPGYFCAGIAWAASWVFGRLAGDLARSRRQLAEMGSYRLLERIGSGGMGEVWLAKHRLLPRRAAVKFVRPAADLRRDPDTVRELARRFEREASAIALLSSPHTVQLYDYGITPDGELFYAMELLDGIDLEELVVRHGAQPEARVVHILTQACLSLAEAHAAGLVHRDIKPGNLMLCRLGELVDVVKVLDFGLVGAAQGALPATAAGGMTGIAGTPGYIAPELLTGQHAASPASDLYALGAVAYWLLTGSTLFPTADGGEDLVAHAMERPVPPSQRGGRPVHPELEALVLACLEKLPERRPASASALRAQLRALRLAEAWDEERMQAWWREHAPRPRFSTRLPLPALEAASAAHASAQPSYGA